jgi:hypothetical protein
VKQLRSISSLVTALTSGLFLTVFGTSEAGPGQSFEDARGHWSYQPIRRPDLPKVQTQARVQSPIDAFLLAKLEEKNLTFALPADHRTLLRRVYYDLVGLPPSWEEIRAFERDESPGAFTNVVEHLLASPRYGECWGRHWLDVARYADTKDLVLAYGKDALRPYAYTYRDYVIRAFNEDLPFNQFVQDQLAADLSSPAVPRWRLAALGFLTLGRMFDNNPHDQIDDQIDTTTRGLLGLTVACARCHDHKYDAITQRDYYGLYGVFASTERPYDLPLLEDPEHVPGGADFEKQLAQAHKELEQHIDTEFAHLTENFRQRFGDYLYRAGTTEPDITETSQFALSLVPDDFRPSLMLRMRHWLQQKATAQDRIFGPWTELMSLPEDGFQALITEKLTTLSAKHDVGQGAPAYNPIVISTLAQAGLTLTNKAAVARTYAQVFRDVYDESKKPAAGSSTGGLTPEQAQLFEIITNADSPLSFPRRDTPNHMSRAEKDRYNTLVSNLDKVAVNATNRPPARAMVVADLSEPYQPHVFRRGNPSRPAESVPRAFLRVLSGDPPRALERGSGRLDLAQAITSPTNPLTARVFVNRVWMHHFGEALVASTTDFGVRSSPPIHPELLDWLASEFIRSGWSVKHLHRMMLFSSAYQQASLPSPSMLQQAQTGDPENKLLSRFGRRRLDFEAMRDSLLFVSGRLDLSCGGPAIDLATDPLSRRRTVYALINRQDLPAMFRAFDFAIPDQCVERRPRTTVPQQALFAMNSPFVIQQAQALAADPQIIAAIEPEQRVEALFGRVLGRLPSESEIAKAVHFVEEAETDSLPERGLNAWEQLAQVLLMSNEALFVD